jgi:hypothetical protein
MVGKAFLNPCGTSGLFDQAKQFHDRRNVMPMRRTCGGLAAMLIATSAFADGASR